MLSAVGRYEPRRPSGARSSTIAGTPRIGADQPAEAEHQVADDGGRDDRRERHRERQREAVLRAREHQERARHDHEQRDRQVRPEQEAVERPEHPEPSGHGLDPPAAVRRPRSPPFAGMTRIRFDGCDLSRRSRHPGCLRLPA